MQSDCIPKRRFDDLSGKVFHDLTVERFSHITERYVRYWHCRCICGRERIVPEHHIKAGVPCKQCRRLRTEAKAAAKKAANYRETRLEYLYRSMETMEVDRSRPWDSYPCLDWPFGASVPKGNCDYGYGVVNENGKQTRITRIVFEKFHRPLLPGEMALHLCDRPICYFWAHLKGGYQPENVQDAVKQKRHCHGEKHGMVKVTEDEVREILRLHATGLYTQRAIARKFPKITFHLVWRIVHKKLWKHIEIN